MGFRKFFQRRNQDSGLAHELEAHLAHQIDENVARGTSKDEERREAYLKLVSPQ